MMDRKVLQTSTETRKAIIALHTRGLSSAEVARQLGVSTRTVWLWVRRYRATACLKDSPRAGRPRGTTPQQDRVIAEAIKADPFTTAVDIKQQHNLPCSVQTIRNRMHALRRGSHSPAKPSLTKGISSGTLPQAASPCPPSVPPLLASSSFPHTPTTLVKKEFGSDAETSASPNNSLSSVMSSSLTTPHAQEMGKNVSLNCEINRTGNEEACVKPEPTWEVRPEWTAVWIKREEEENDFKVEVQDEAVEAEERVVTSPNSQGSCGAFPCHGTLHNTFTPVTLELSQRQQIMDVSASYNSHDEENSSDEDFIPFSASDSSSNEESDGSESTDDSERETEDDPAHATSPALSQGWGPVSSKQRSYTFSGKEELAVLPQINSITGKPYPIDMYELFITVALLDIFVTETNKYAQQKINESPLTRRSRLNSWKPTTRDEMRKFIGIIVYMGMVPMPEISLYWSKSRLYSNSYISRVMTRERFEILLRCLHFRDNTDVDDPLDPLFKLRPLVTAIRDCCQAIYKPGPDFVIDESTVPFRGRVHIRQYIPGKAHEYGFKVYKLCTPSGYRWNFMIHAGSHKKSQGLNSTESLTVKFCENQLEKGATLYASNYYCSLVLAEYLLDKKTYLCGTMNSTRKYLPKVVTEIKLRKKEMKALENSRGVKVFKWRDKQNVLTISTVPEHSGRLVPSGKTNKRKEEVSKPESVMAYSKAKKGVDISDQYMSYHSPFRKTRKWYRKLAFELVAGLSVVNAWVLHCQYFPSTKMDQLQFRESLVYSLTGNEPGDIRPWRNLGLVSGERCSHILAEKDGPKSDTRKRCRGCYEKISLYQGFKVAASKARKVNTFCNDCEDKPHLCITCFAEKHSA